MGDHFLPQRYLRGFARPGESRLWTYEKGKELPRFLPIPVIAEENELYGDLEPLLARDVEAPANRVLKKIIEKEALAASDKLDLSAYIYILRKRVPSGFKRFRDRAPEIAVLVMDKIKSKLDPSQPDYEDKIGRLKAGLDELVKHPSKKIWRQAILVSNELSTQTLSQMTWTFYTCEEPEAFATSDNPVFFDGDLGINKRESEVSFPISSRICLLTAWWKRRDLLYVQAKPSEVRELNRRTAYGAARWMFSGAEHDWIATLLNKKAHNLRRFAPPEYRQILRP